MITAGVVLGLFLLEAIWNAVSIRAEEYLRYGDQLSDAQEKHFYSRRLEEKRNDHTAAATGIVANATLIGMTGAMGSGVDPPLLKPQDMRSGPTKPTTPFDLPSS